MKRKKKTKNHQVYLGLIDYSVFDFFKGRLGQNLEIDFYIKLLDQSSNCEGPNAFSERILVKTGILWLYSHMIKWYVCVLCICWRKGEKWPTTLNSYTCKDQNISVKRNGTFQSSNILLQNGVRAGHKEWKCVGK